MPGRKRRASTSSVDTVEGSQVRWLHETSVVRSVPSNSDSDEWPCFELRDAVVYDREGKALDNALYVATRGPFTVRGRLIIEEPSQKAHMIIRVKTSTPIEIRNCVKYAIGQENDGDGDPCIWLAGKGGWYEIQPSEAYLPIYLKMCEATTMYYSIIDSCLSEKFKRSQKKSAKSGRLDRLHDIFLQYTIKAGDGSTFDEVIERCGEHAPFFINQFRDEPPETIVWMDTDFYKWFMHEFANMALEIEDLTRNPRPPYRVPSIDIAPPSSRERSSRLATRSASIEEVLPSQAPSSRAPSIQMPERPKSISREIKDSHSTITPITVASSQADDIASTDQDSSPLASVLTALESIYNSKGSSKRGITVSNTLTTLYFDYKFPSYRDGTSGSYKIPVSELLHFHAKQLLQHLDRAKYERHELYGYLQELSQKPFSSLAYKPSDFPLRLIPRKPMHRQSKKTTEGVNISPAPGVADGTPEEDENEPCEAPRPMGKTIKQPGRRGRKAGLRTITASKKRLHAELESDSEGEYEVSVAKKPNTSHYFPDKTGNIDMEFAPQAPQKGSKLVNTEVDDHLELVEEPIPIVIRAEKIPSSAPKGPDGTWTCDESGCGYIVRGGDEEDCQARIKQHFTEHEEAAKRLNLAVTESTRGHTSVNHLLEKLKRMGEKAQMKEVLNLAGTKAPQPIKRKLIV